MNWDYVIVGAGSAGCSLANELSRDGASVLLLEAGGSTASPFVRLPIGIWNMPKKYDWAYYSEPDPSRHGSVDHWHRGKGLGGCSSVNGMVYVRGAPEDYDRWDRECGSPGIWTSSNVATLFRELECSDQQSQDRGSLGKLFTRTVRRPHPLSQAFIDSCVSAGFGLLGDYNAGRQDGVGLMQYTQRRGLRWSAANAFLRNPRQHRNLTVMRGCEATRLELESGSVKALYFYRRGKIDRVSARNFILSAGVINSPKLLMLSGIGDRKSLEKVGIDCVLDLPGVGLGLKEHPYVELDLLTNVPSYNLTEGIGQKLAIAWKYLTQREGPLSGVYEAAAFLPRGDGLAGPNYQILFAPIGWIGDIGDVALRKEPSAKIVVIHSHARGSGQISLKSNDPKDAPIISSSLLANEDDISAICEGVELIREILTQGPFRKLLRGTIEPDSSLHGDSLRAWVRRNASLAAHPTGTCRMGIDHLSVVTPDLKVHGVDNLYVADASIMPDLISANLNGPSIMIGAMLGKMLKGAAKAEMLS